MSKVANVARRWTLRSHQLRHLVTRRNLTRGFRSQFERNPDGNVVEPATKRFSSSNGSSFSAKHEESCLQAIFRIVGVANNAETRSVHHRSMPFEQAMERGFVMLGYKRFQKT